MADSNLDFTKPKDAERKIKITGSKDTYYLKSGQLKQLLARLSESYSKTEGDRTAMDAILCSFIDHFNITDKLAIQELRALSTDRVEQLYAADPQIAVASSMTRRGFYVLRHRELLSAWHAEADVID